MDTETHWTKVWTDDDGSGRSWFQESPARSLELIRSVAPPPAAVLDVGAGSSRLVDALLDDGYPRPAVLDITEAALAHTRRRLGDRAGMVDWIVADVTTLDVDRTFDVWHDRAVLHFLVDPADQARYADAVKRHVRPGGHVVLATFSPDGPTSCSGLPVQQHDAASLRALLGDRWVLAHDHLEQHTTPSGAVQEFTWAVFRREGGP